MNLSEKIMELGAFKTGVVLCKNIPFDPIFRKACEANSCGMFGKCHMCPPDVGAIDVLIEKAKTYTEAIVYQTICEIEDSFDIEGMLEAGARHNVLAQEISKHLKSLNGTWLHLGAGGCRVCEKCAKRDNLPCRFPNEALASLEAYGVSVSELASLAGMKYINGQNTVTYFGAVLRKD